MHRASCVKVWSWMLIGGALLSAAPVWGGSAKTAGAAAAEESREPALYDPAADPAEQLAAAVDEATATHRRILLEVGGDWCIWCHHLHDFLATHDSVRTLWDDSFVTVSINVSPENRNEAFLADYPAIPGYPHLFVLAPDGSLLHSQNTGDLEKGEGYSKAAVLDFLSRWAPPQQAR